MTDAELAELVGDCPTLYHMAEGGGWPAIRQHGLLSTSALLNLYGVEGPQREVDDLLLAEDDLVDRLAGLSDRTETGFRRGDDAVIEGGGRLGALNHAYRSWLLRVGRQGPGARTHLLSPAMAAAAAVTGRLVDVRELMG